MELNMLKKLRSKKFERIAAPVLGSDLETKRLIYAILKVSLESGDVLVASSDKRAARRNPPKSNLHWTVVEKRLLYKEFKRMFMRQIRFTQAIARELSTRFKRTPAAISAQYYAWESRCKLVEV